MGLFGVNWDDVRDQFELRKDYIHIATSMFISSHPRLVREKIEKHRKELDQDPTKYLEVNEIDYGNDVRKRIANYFGVKDPNDIALTSSATMGHGIIYNGLKLNKGQEILCSEHNHYSHQESILRATDRTGATYREIPIYKRINTVTEDEIITSLLKEITEKTKVLAITWVHSDTGLKSPVAKIAKEISVINKSREEENKILLIVDGVHGFGIETETFEELGCDFFITSTHKWVFGPRGTGFVAGTKEAWKHVSPVIPSYRIMNQVSKQFEHPAEMDGVQMTPGGFHAHEHRWALPVAFDFVDSIGKKHIYNRVHDLNKQCKEGLADIPNVSLHTPMDTHLSAGITSFEINGLKSKDVVNKLLKKKIIATVAPYYSEYTRLTPGIINTPEEVDIVLDVIRSIAK
ncbi:aminotransferase class V-fold PLP-dependent enzyme [Bacillus sp. JCM 19034]|uniref:aminotransferase class V-fold PLP-dependent enzyme n=1 Tax=Bacillus sp. JCM 19034 TaxID=1481928 RepID=UPI000781E366|nr:aminotransferase class V-fold PLP-dependent enzyme [Bacillus sp. JCM 19034]